MLLVAVTLAGLNVQRTVAGCPLQEKDEKVPVQPLAVMMFRVSVPAAPGATLSEEDVRLPLKLGAITKVGVTVGAPVAVMVQVIAVAGVQLLLQPLKT